MEGAGIMDEPNKLFDAAPSYHAPTVEGVEVEACRDVVLSCDGASGAPELEQQMAARFASCFAIWKQRQRKYGSDNIARRGPAGILVRMDDKLARLERTLTHQRDDKAADFADETLADTCADIANYALMIHVCESGHWPGWPHP
jgi:hypothetical protein